MQYNENGPTGVQGVNHNPEPVIHAGNATGKNPTGNAGARRLTGAMYKTAAGANARNQPRERVPINLLGTPYVVQNQGNAESTPKVFSGEPYTSNNREPYNVAFKPYK